MLMSWRVSGRKVEEFRENLKTVRGTSRESGHRDVCSRAVDVGVERGEKSTLKHHPGGTGGFVQRGGAAIPAHHPRDPGGTPTSLSLPGAEVATTRPLSCRMGRGSGVTTVPGERMQLCCPQGPVQQGWVSAPEGTLPPTQGMWSCPPSHKAGTSAAGC